MLRITQVTIPIAAVATLALAGCDERYVRRDEFNAAVAELRGMDARQQAQAEELKLALQERINDHDVKITELKEGRVRVDMTAHFEYKQTDLRDEDKRALDDFAAVVRERGPNVLVTVEGFTDSAGPREYNKWLGQKRADAVRDYLIANGLRRGQIRSISYGEDPARQVLPHATGNKASFNRRVALVIEYAPDRT